MTKPHQEARLLQFRWVFQPGWEPSMGQKKTFLRGEGRTGSFRLIARLDLWSLNQRQPSWPGWDKGSIWTSFGALSKRILKDPNLIKKWLLIGRSSRRICTNYQLITCPLQLIAVQSITLRRGCCSLTLSVRTPEAPSYVCPQNRSWPVMSSHSTVSR